MSDIDCSLPENEMMDDCMKHDDEHHDEDHGNAKMA